MKRIQIFLMLLLFSFLTACNIRINEQAPSLFLSFNYLTGNWKTLEELSSEERKDDPALMENYWEQKETEQTGENLNQQLAGTEYSFHFWSELWELYHKEKLVATGKSLDYFLTDKKHVIVCTWNMMVYPECFIDNQWKPTYTIQAFPKIFDNQVYAIVSSGERSHQLFQWEQLLYSFEAFFPTDVPLLGLEVDENGWRLWYRTIPSEHDGIQHHLIHNGENLNQENKRTDVFELRKIKNQIFYFYQKDGKIWYHLWGKDYETPFEEIVHDHCCRYAGYDIEFREDFFTLYAKKDGRFGYYSVAISS